VTAVDPQQTLLPEDWKRLPAYRVRPGEAMLLSETHRGEVDRGPDQLALAAQLVARLRRSRLLGPRLAARRRL
jgi:hypothetical protein